MKFKMFFILLLLVSTVSAVCTVVLDADSYNKGETATATLNCDDAAEKSKAYTVTWYNETDDVQHTDTGTTPSTAGTDFFEVYSIPIGYVGLNITANMTGSSLEGDDLATVTGSAGDELVINGFTFSAAPILLGEVLGIHADIKDENGKGISGAKCAVSIEDSDSQPVVVAETESYASTVHVNFDLSHHAFEEDEQYVAQVFCYCGKASTEDSCVDEDGTEVDLSSGTGSEVFNVETWLEVNTVVDASVYVPRETIFVCANVTNVNGTERVPLEIYHQVRCSSEGDNDADTDRALLVSDGVDFDKRGISVGATQMQCKMFVVPELKYLGGKTNECYASTEVWVVDKDDHRVLHYATTSGVFNITSDELNLHPDWQRVGDYEFQAIVNLSADAFRDYNGIGQGNIDIKLSTAEGSIASSEQFGIDFVEFENLLSTKYINNFTVMNASGDYYTAVLEYLDDGSLEIEVRDAELGNGGYYVVNLTLNSFEERQTDALEGIENKTGTFRLGVDCVADAWIGDEFNCTVTAQIESEDGLSKETDFECYILDGSTKYSVVNFNKMITEDLFTISKEFTVPNSFVNAEEYTVQCEARYYNFGSRVDTVSDTFRAIADSGGQPGPGPVPGDPPVPEPEPEPEPEVEDPLLSVVAGLGVRGLFDTVDHSIWYLLLGIGFVWFWKRKEDDEEPKPL